MTFTGPMKIPWLPIKNINTFGPSAKIKKKRRLFKKNQHLQIVHSNWREKKLPKMSKNVSTTKNQPSI